MTTSNGSSNGIRNRKGHAYEAYLPSSLSYKYTATVVEDEPSCTSSNSSSTLLKRRQQQHQVLTTLKSWYEFLLMVLFSLSLAVVILGRAMVHFSRDDGIWRISSTSSVTTTTTSSSSSSSNTRETTTVHPPPMMKDRLLASPSSSVSTGDGSPEDDLLLRGSFNSAAMKHRSETRGSNALSSIELSETDDDSISLTPSDEAYAELPIEIGNSNNRNMTISFWVKLLPSTAAKRRIFWTTTSEHSYGMTFLLERDSYNQYWWKIEYGTTSTTTTTTRFQDEYLYSLTIAPLHPSSSTIKNFVNTSGTSGPIGHWTHVAWTLEVTNNSYSHASISLFINGTLVEHKSRLPIPTTILHDHTNVNNNRNNKSSRTILGRDYDNSASISHLHGYLAMMTIWYHGHTTFMDQDIEHIYNVGRVTTETSSTNSNNDHDFYRTYYHSLNFGNNPTYFYPFNDAANMKRKNPEFFLHVELESSFDLKEWMQENRTAHGTFFRRVPIPHFQPLGGYRYSQYKDGTYTSPQTFDVPARKESDRLARKRRVHVRNAMKHAWNGYRTYAWGYDELRPQSKKGDNNWGAQATTIIDSLSTLWVMGMHDEFYEARDWIRDNLSYDHVGEVSVFETTIRNLGGLLAAFDVTEDVTFLKKADDLGSRLVRSITDSPSGIPYGMTVLNDTSVKGKSYNQRWLGNNAVLAELGTIQLEFRYLAAATGKKEYATAVNKILKVVGKINPGDGLYSIYIKNDVQPCFGGMPHAKISFGAMGDSFYEYMLKVWLQGGKRETNLRTMYDRAMDGLHNRMIRKSIPSGLTYIAELVGDAVDQKMDHLACFMGGLLALGAYTNPDGLDSKTAQRDLETAKALTYTCYQMYARTKTGLSSEAVNFHNSDGNTDFVPATNARFYVLRPEVVESIYILSVLTGDPIYREWGWEIFQAIEHFCRTDVGYGSSPDVNEINLLPDDRMESFFLAETLKYLYLIQDPDSTLDILNSHVFNTEAHPLKILHNVKEIKI